MKTSSSHAIIWTGATKKSEIGDHGKRLAELDRILPPFNPYSEVASPQ